MKHPQPTELSEAVQARHMDWCIGWTAASTHVENWCPGTSGTPAYVPVSGFTSGPLLWAPCCLEDSCRVAKHSASEGILKFLAAGAF